MRSLIATVFSVTTLLSVCSSAFAQGAQPAPSAAIIGKPSTAPSPSGGETGAAEERAERLERAERAERAEQAQRAWPEPGRYHPCPSSVGFGNGRSVCLGLDEPRRHVRHVHVASYGHYVPGGYGYYDFGPCRHCAAQRFYQSIEALTGCPVAFSMQ